MSPTAYFLTWSCYGTRCLGDARSSVHHAHNIYGHPRIPPTRSLEAYGRHIMASNGTTLGKRERRVVRAAIDATCAHRGWKIHAMNVRTTHVHVVLSSDGLHVDRVLGQLKAWATRRLREEGYVAADARVWAKHGSTRYLWDAEDVAMACDYVVHGQGGDLG